MSAPQLVHAHQRVRPPVARIERHRALCIAYGLTIAAPVGGRHEPYDVEICLPGQGVEPGQFDADVFVGVVLVEVDAQRVRAVGSVDAEDDVGEPTDESEAQWFDGKLSQGG